MANFKSVDEYVAAQSEQLQAIAVAMVPVIDARLPGAGAMWHGHPVWSLGDAPGKNPVCLLKAYPGYLTFGLWRGRELGDDRIDTSGGMPHVKLRAVSEIDTDLFGRWLALARDLALSEVS